MALDVSLEIDGDADSDSNDTHSPVIASVDANAETALVAAIKAWQAARAQLDAVDPKKLSRRSRNTYERVVARIGLWSDARAFGESIEADDE